MRTVLTGTSPADNLRRVAVRQLLDTLRTMPLTGSRMPIARALDRIRNMILLRVDRIVVDGDVHVVRNIRSGRRGSDDADSLSATMLIKAVEEAFGVAGRIENHYLLSGDPLEIAQTSKKFGNRVAACEKAVADIRRGTFDPVPSDFRCPRCAHLFICAAP